MNIHFSLKRLKEGLNLLITTIIFFDGEERQFPAEAVTIGEPSERLVRVDLAHEGVFIIPLYAIREVHTRDLPADAVSPEIFNEDVPS